MNCKSILFNILKSVEFINIYLIETDDTDIIYLDFSKEFDAVFHYGLIVFMKNLGISKNTKANIVLTDRTFLKHIL